MLRTLTLTTILITCLLGITTAQDKVLVGFTIATTQGNIPPFAFHDKCTDEFTNSTWCTSRDIYRSGPGNTPTSAGNAWVQPVFIGAGGSATIDFSGAGAGGSLTHKNCNFWTLTTITGLQIDIATGSFSLGNCVDPKRIACCAIPNDNGGGMCIDVGEDAAPCTETTNCCSGVGICTSGNPGQRVCQ